jgi:hypothetical protein
VPNLLFLVNIAVFHCSCHFSHLEQIILATPRKPPESLFKKVPGHVKRSHYACRLREDYHDWLREELKRLNCSQGVFLELLLSAHMREPIVKPEDVFHYDSEERRLDVGGES